MKIEFEFLKHRRSLTLPNVENLDDSKIIIWVVIVFLATLSIGTWVLFYLNGLSIAYNDARSHLDIGRRVVEGLKPGLAQLGSVWLPLPHVLMLPTIWNDFMWHSGLSGSLVSMISFIFTGVLVFKLLEKLGASNFGKVFGVVVFAVNLNILYLQATPMTELLLLSTTTASIYYLVVWVKEDKIYDLIKCAFWLMLSTLIRYDGWFLLLMIGAIIAVRVLLRKGYKTAEGTVVLFGTLASLGILGWLGWNQLIFKDALYFAFGPFSAHAQQTQLQSAGVLQTEGNILLSTKVYLYALIYNTGAFSALLGLIGAVMFFADKRTEGKLRFAALALFGPLLFNIVALFLGHSVLFIQGISGPTWFNVRYGAMMIPSIAVFIGFLVSRATRFKLVILSLFFFTFYFSFHSVDAVTIDDARVGSSQKNVSEVSGYLNKHAKDKKGFILISAASHDAIIFSSGLPMKRFIHEGTGAYWTAATASADRWARWIVMRTHDTNDLTFKEVGKSAAIRKYHLVANYPFADVYELNDEFLPQLQTEAILGKQR